jgi:SAM-dependent methyltransferase
VLELACGTGAICLPLAQAGLAVTGLDSAPAMLQEARRKADATGVVADWVLADMTRFDLGTRFDLIILAANSLCHLLDRAAFEGCMTCVRRHLTPAGRFIIDVFVPDPRLLARPAGERYRFGRYEDPDGRGEIIIEASNAYAADTQINHITTYHRFPGEPAETIGQLDLRMYYPQELDALLTYNGLCIDHKLAGYGGESFGPAATKQLLLCSAPTVGP